MLIGKIANAAGVAAQTVRFYERRGLLPPPERGSNGYRTYDEAVLSRLRFIRTAQAADLTLDEINSIMTIRAHGESPCRHVEALLQDKVAHIQAQRDELAALQAELEQLLTRSHNLDPLACSADQICHVLP